MDSKIIQQYGEDILSYRLRTARQKKRMQYKDFDKYLIQLDKEERALYVQRRNLGWEPLIPPVQKGWKRFFVLRDDVARSKQSEFFQGILKKINTYEWSHRKDFKVKKRKFGRKKYVVREQKMLEPGEWHFAKLAFNEGEKQMFHEEFSYDKWRRQLIKRYVFNEPWRFAVRVKPNMITKVRIKDPVLESRIERISNYLQRNDFRWTQTRLLYGSCKWRLWNDFEKYDERNPFRDWPLERILDSLKEEL